MKALRPERAKVADEGAAVRKPGYFSTLAASGP